MIPVIFINCSKYPFIAWIIAGLKIYETRTRNTLKRFVGHTVYLAETSKGKPVIECLATITEVEVVHTRSQYNALRKLAKIVNGSAYDWKQGTKTKYFYKLENVQPVPEFLPPDGVRHGRIWMEYNEKQEG